MNLKTMSRIFLEMVNSCLGSAVLTFMCFSCQRHHCLILAIYSFRKSALSLNLSHTVGFLHIFQFLPVVIVGYNPVVAAGNNFTYRENNLELIEL